MTIKEVRAEVIRVIRDIADVPMTEQTHLIKELGLTSVEIMMMISDLEDRFGIDISTKKLRDVWTVGDLCDLVTDELR